MSVVTPYLLLLKDRVHKRHQVFQSCEWDFAHQLLSPMEMQIAKEYLELSPNSHQIAQKIKIYWNVKKMPQERWRNIKKEILERNRPIYIQTQLHQGALEILFDLSFHIILKYSLIYPHIKTSNILCYITKKDVSYSHMYGFINSNQLALPTNLTPLLSIFCISTSMLMVYFKNSYSTLRQHS